MHIFLLEPNTKRAHQLKRSLGKMAYQVDHFTEPDVALTRLERKVSDYDVLVVNSNLRTSDLLAWCKEVRALSIETPILVFSKSEDVMLPITALLSYADDFIALPIRTAELIARLQALSRRPRVVSSPQITVGNLTVDTQSRVLRSGDSTIIVSSKELMIIEFLMKHSPEVVPRTKVLGHVWEVPDAVINNTLDVHIKNLRRKIPANAGCLIETIRGIGYRAIPA